MPVRVKVQTSLATVSCVVLSCRGPLHCWRHLRSGDVIHVSIPFLSLPALRLPSCVSPPSCLTLRSAPRAFPQLAARPAFPLPVSPCPPTSRNDVLPAPLSARALSPRRVCCRALTRTIRVSLRSVSAFISIDFSMVARCPCSFCQGSFPPDKGVSPSSSSLRSIRRRR